MSTLKTHANNQDHLWKAPHTTVVDNVAVTVRDVCVYNIRIGDTEDPDIAVAEPIWQWQQTEAGKFIMQHAVEQPYYVSHIDYTMYGHVYKIMARLRGPDETFWRLKWG